MKRYLFVANEKKRRAVSEIIGTLLMVAVTLIAGAAVFGFVNGQAAASENQYGASVAKNVNYFNEHFVVVSVQFSNSFPTNPSPCAKSGGQTYCNQVSISIYNNGAVDLTISQITLKNMTSKSSSGATVPKMSITSDTTSTRATGYACTSTGISSTSVKQNVVPPVVFTFTLPACISAASGILVGGSYQIQVLGSYGNTATAQVTASG